MPNLKSAKKRVLINQANTEKNRALNSALKTAVKKANTAIEANDEDKQEKVTFAIKKIDQAAAKGLIHKNNAANKKSALAIKAKNA
ncbi:MAG: 30S ribosomal protein S20 [Firmicutes bacterium ADurb.Bin300]|jgi:small subunit ribosomal protein S20|nr:MAG: 30S ribosomal protein S20 [Firmicutes bacterium ADurb.Bin300]HOD01911.1 30S ribosomal protein S20 [Clostridiales bacterium]